MHPLVDLRVSQIQAARRTRALLAPLTPFDIAIDLTRPSPNAAVRTRSYEAPPVKHQSCHGPVRVTWVEKVVICYRTAIAFGGDATAPV